MPIVRYQIRSEYGLADPELYGAADKDDPEALLEGVAMAGLVGVLRQLGDLAEFAAEIFHDLHEEVMATAARGHALTLRVRQLEAEFPAIEKGFLTQSSHSPLSYNAGNDWHPNLQIDQSLLTREDMPRFILDSYEESRGPPRLFMLDKFDIAGDGACLKRYSDPSFFKMDFSSSGKMEPDIRREKKSRKNKKKVPRWRNGETPESYVTPLVNPKLEHVASEKATENPPVKRVKLKTRQLNDNTSIGRSYTEHILEKQSLERTGLSENSVTHSQVKMETIDSTELTPEVREVIMDTSIDRPLFRKRKQTKPYNTEEVQLSQKEETAPYKRDSLILKNDKKELLQKAADEIEKPSPTFHKVDQAELLVHIDCKREGDDVGESKTNGSLDGYRSDDVASELDNYLDALTTMDSEIETDNETKAKADQSVLIKEYNKMISNVNEERESLTGCHDLHMSSESSYTQNILPNKGMSNPPSEDSLNGLAGSIPSHGISSTLLSLSADPEKPRDRTQGISFENERADSKLLEKKSSIDLVPMQMTPEILGTFTESQVESSGSCIPDGDVVLVNTSLQSCPEHADSATADQNVLSDNANSATNIDICFDAEHSSPINSVAQETAPDVNDAISSLVEGHDDVDGLLEGDFHQRLEESRVSSIAEDDYVDPGLTAKTTETFSDAALILGGEPDMNIGILDDPSLETQMAVPWTEEASDVGVMSKPSVSSPQIHAATNLEVTSSTCVEDTPFPLSMYNKEELQSSVVQDPEVDSGVSTLPRSHPPIFPLNENSSTFIPDGLSGHVDNSVSADEKFEYARSLSNHEDAADFTENQVRSLENATNLAENEIVGSAISSPGPSFDMKVSQESCNLDEVEFTQERELPDILKVLPIASDCETKDSPSPTGDQFNLPSDMMSSSSPMELLGAESSQEPSSNYTNLQDDRSCSDSVLDEQNLEVTEASSLRDFMHLDIQHIPGTSASHEEYVVVTCPQDSESAVSILDSSSQPDSGEHNHIWHTEPIVLAEEDLYPSDGKMAAKSLVEVEGGEHLNPTLPNEYTCIGSDMGNTKTSNPEDLTRADEQQASKIAFPQQEVDEVVSVPENSKSAESIHDSFDHVDLKPVADVPCQEDCQRVCSKQKLGTDERPLEPVANVPCQEDHQMVLSPRNSGTEERPLESSFDTSAIESVEHAEHKMHPLEVTEVITSTMENQQVSHPKPLPLNEPEPSETANGDVLLSNDVITEGISPLREELQSSDESNEISLQRKLESLNLCDIQSERGQSLQQDDDSTEAEKLPSAPEVQDWVEDVSSDKIYELDITSANVSSFNKLELEVDSPFPSAFGTSVSSAKSNAPLASLQSFPSLGASGSAVIQQQQSELPLGEDPPLPPLPPLQWRMGRLRPSSVIPNGEMAENQSGLNHLTALTSLDHSDGLLVTGGTAAKPQNPFLFIQALPNDSFSCETLKDKSGGPFQPSALPPAMEVEKCQNDMFSMDVQMRHLLPNSSFVVSHVEDKQQKNEICQEDLSGKLFQSVNPLTQLAISDVRSQSVSTVTEGESIEPPKSSTGLPTLAYTESEHGTVNVETAVIHPSNPFLSSTSAEVENYQNSYGPFGGRMVQHPNYPEPLSATVMAPKGFFLSQWGNMQAPESETVPVAEHEKPNGRPRSLLNRPRDPLIEAVAAHDKSTLRRVSELVRPSARPEGERNTLLEQIRSKSFNLKPATVTKPNMKGPTTNLKVAAILERANAIRQACVGSDEDDDGDSWSDS